MTGKAYADRKIATKACGGPGPALAANCGGGRSLVRHQYGNRHRPENAPRNAAEYEFAQARVPVPAHDHKVGAGIGRVRQQNVGDVDIAKDRALDLDIERSEE